MRGPAATNEPDESATTPGHPTPDGVEWAAVMAEVARDLQGHHEDVEDTLATVTHGATQVVPGVDFACVTVVSKTLGVTSRGATDPAAERINEIQQALNQGPCLSALWDQPLIRVDHLDASSRFPAYSAAAAELGIAESLSVRLYVKDVVLGALSLYSRTPGAMTNETVEAATLYSAHAAVALFAAELEANLNSAIDRRDMIGQAKGILMERFKLTDTQAFKLLVRVSQNTNTPMREVADKLTQTGDVTGLPSQLPLT